MPFYRYYQYPEQERCALEYHDSGNMQWHNTSEAKKFQYETPIDDNKMKNCYDQ